MNNKIIIGSRGSKLSLAYANRVKNLISNIDLIIGNKIIIETIKTSGDLFQGKKISEIGGKNLFCKEIEEKLIRKEIDIAVHSLKDMDSIETKGLVIHAYIERNDPRETFVSKKFEKLSEINKGNIGSSSRRRELQLKLINKNITVKNIRGNVDTRINKVKGNIYDATILANAGVSSLDFNKDVSYVFSIDEMLPSAGQGVIALQSKADDNFINNLLNKINHRQTYLSVKSERNVLKVLDGDCETAIGVYSIIKDDIIELKAELFSIDGNERFYIESSKNVGQADELGLEVGENLKRQSKGNYKK